MQSISDKVLKGMSAFSALRLAVSLSGRADDEIAAAMNWSPRVANRIFFKRQLLAFISDIAASLRRSGQRYTCPLGNGQCRRAAGACGRCGRSHARHPHGRAFSEKWADVAGEGRRALEDGAISDLDARRILRELRGVLDKGAEFMGRLQANLEQA